MTIHTVTHTFDADGVNKEKLLRVVSVAPKSQILLQVPIVGGWMTARTYVNSDAEIIDTAGKQIRIVVNGKGSYQFD